jgi:hypothetical protein
LAGAEIAQGSLRRRCGIDTFAAYGRAMRAVAVVVVFLVAGCGARQTGAAAGLIPWVDRPAPAYTASPWTMPLPAPASAPACTAAQLRVTGVHDGAAAGSFDERFVFTNVGTATCTFGGRPVITGTVDGRRRIVEPRRAAAGTFTGLLIPVDLRPGQRGFFDWTFADACPARRTAHAIDFQLPGGGTVHSGRSAPLITCSRSAVSALGRYAPAPRPRPAVPGTPGTLQVRLSLQNLQRIVSGRTLHYIVTLRNPTHGAVNLEPCPSYTESLYPAGPPVVRSYRLNCDAVRRIAPGGRVRYAMRLSIPRVPEGMAKLTWSLNTPRMPAAVAVVLLSGATSP